MEMIDVSFYVSGACLAKMELKKNRELVLAIFFVLLGSLFLAKNTSPHKRDF